MPRDSSLTLEDIGRLAGVSRSTVSRVVNGQPRVSPDARKRVLAVIEETGFAPNQAARSLASNRTDVFGLVVPSNVGTIFNDPYFGIVIEGVSKACNELGKTLALFLFHTEEQEANLYPRVVNNRSIDGVILTASRRGDPIQNRLTDGDLPFVMIGRPDQDQIPHVDIDNFSGAKQATEHLLGLGRQRVGFIAADQNTTAGVDRSRGFLAALSDAGIDPEPALLAEGNFTETGGYTAMQSLLGAEPDAVFAASDRMAAGALRAISEAELEVPQDIALIGFDGLPAATESNPVITTMSQPITETGSLAVELLAQVVDDPDREPERVELPVEFTPGQTS